jgi:hypothetical protein
MSARPTTDSTGAEAAEQSAALSLWSVQFGQYLLEAGLDEDERMAAMLHYARVSPVALRETLGVTAYAAECLLARVGRKLARVVPDYHQPANAFPRQLVECLRNSRIADDPEFPPTSEAPTRVYDRLPAASTITGSDRRLRQPAGSTLRLLHQAREPALVG